MRRDLLRPLKRRVKPPRPSYRHVRISFFRAPVVVVSHLHRLGQSQDAVVSSHLIKRALDGAFGTGTIVAADIDDQRVIELAHVFDSLNDTANLMIRVGDVTGERLRLAGT